MSLKYCLKVAFKSFWLDVEKLFHVLSAHYISRSVWIVRGLSLCKGLSFRKGI